jgi:hypothetical protein
MPVVFREEGYVASFYSNEGHEPVHVHIRKGGGEAKFWVEPVQLDESAGLKVQELARAEELVQQHAAMVVQRWHEYFGR